MTSHGAPNAARVQANYGAWARVYDWFARATASVGGVRADCAGTLDLAPGDTVVEFGCGPGVNLPVLREAVGPEGRVVGVDITREMLERARVLVARRGWENVHLVRGDATTPPVQHADGVLATFVTSLFPDPYDVVARWCSLADSIVIANFAPGGGRAANTALWVFAWANARLFDADGTRVLGQLESRMEASVRALRDNTDAVERRTHVLGTITVAGGQHQ